MPSNNEPTLRALQESWLDIYLCDQHGDIESYDKAVKKHAKMSRRTVENINDMVHEKRRRGELPELIERLKNLI